MKQSQLLLGTALLATGLIYLPVFWYGFAQDDFIHLYASQIFSIGDFFNFFNPFAKFPEIFFFRPLTTQAYFAFNRYLFGLTALPFHIEALTVHVANTVLFYWIVRKLWRSTGIALFSAFLYGISASHFLSLYYISSFQEIGRIFFLFAAIYLFIVFRESGLRIYFWLSLGAFVCALLSKETSVVLPFLLLPIEYLRSKKCANVAIAKNWLILLLPFFGVLVVYGVVRLAGFQTIFGIGKYSSTFVFGDVLQNLKWYVAWLLGLPEALSTYPSLGLSSIARFWQDFPEAPIVLVSFGLTVGLLVYSWLRAVKDTFCTYITIALFALFSIVPVLVLHAHKYPQYLDLPYLLVLPLFTQWLLSDRVSKVVPMLFLVCFVVLQYTSLSISRKNHWATNRALGAAYYLDVLKRTPRTQLNGKIVLFVGQENAVNDLAVTLAKDKALKVFFPGRVKATDYRAITDTRLIPKDPSYYVVQLLR